MTIYTFQNKSYSLRIPDKTLSHLLFMNFPSQLLRWLSEDKYVLNMSRRISWKKFEDMIKNLNPEKDSSDVVHLLICAMSFKDKNKAIDIINNSNLLNVFLVKFFLKILCEK